MFAAGDLPDVCTLTYYDPRIDLVSDKLLDLSGYDFTDNYVESRSRWPLPCTTSARSPLTKRSSTSPAG